jgi:hypothetical protein
MNIYQNYHVPTMRLQGEKLTLRRPLWANKIDFDGIFAGRISTITRFTHVWNSSHR